MTVSCPKYLNILVNSPCAQDSNSKLRKAQNSFQHLASDIVEKQGIFEFTFNVFM